MCQCISLFMIYVSSSSLIPLFTCQCWSQTKHWTVEVYSLFNAEAKWITNRKLEHNCIPSAWKGMDAMADNVCHSQIILEKFSNRGWTSKAQPDMLIFFIGARPQPPTHLPSSCFYDQLFYSHWSHQPLQNLCLNCSAPGSGLGSHLPTKYELSRCSCSEVINYKPHINFRNILITPAVHLKGQAHLHPSAKNEVPIFTGPLQSEHSINKQFINRYDHAF